MLVDYDNNDLDPDVVDTQCGRNERIRKVLQFLRLSHISLLDCILDILDTLKPNFTVRRFLFNPSGKLTRMLDLIFENDRGRAQPCQIQTQIYQSVY